MEGERSQDFVAADLSEPSPAGGQLGSVAQAPATPKGFAPLLPMTGKREQLVSDQGPSRLWTWSTWSLLIWGAGALFLLASRGIGLLQVWRIKGRAKRIREPSWRALVAQLAAELGLGRRVTLLASDRSISPMSWGVWRPVILLPAAREEWSDPCRRVVLLHELAHIKRLDYVSQMLAQLARALYWFNPLVWLACRQLRIEREQACDDQVLAAGTKPSDYSTHLLEIARSIQLPRWGWQGAVAMARHSQIEGRLLAILDSRRSHRALSRRAQGLILLTVCLVVLPLATIGFTSGSTAAIRSTEAPAPTPAAAKEPGPSSAEYAKDKPTTGMVLRQLQGYRGLFYGALSPDGHYLSYREQETGDLAVRELDTGKERRLTQKADGSTERAGVSIFSPDSKQVAYAWRNEDNFNDLRIVGLEESQPRVLYRNSEVIYITPAEWSPDGKDILGVFAGGGTRRIGLVSVSDGSLRVLKSLDWRYPGKMNFSPDGRYIVYDVPPKEESPQRDLFLLASDGSREIPLVKHPADDYVLGWSPDGRWILFASDRRGTWDAWAIEVADGKSQGAPEMVKLGIGEIYPVGFTRNGAYYYIHSSGGISDIYTAMIDPTTGKVLAEPTKLDQRMGFNVPLDWSADGQYLAYFSQRGAFGPRPAALFIRSVDTGEERTLSLRLKVQVGLSGRWSPDGRSFLVLASDRKNRSGLYQVDAQTGKMTLVVKSKPEEYAVYPEWSPDGKAIFYQLSARGVDTVMMRDFETGREKELVRVGRWKFSISPDGRWLAFSGPENPGPVLKLMPVAGGETRELCRLNDPPQTYPHDLVWTPDGSQLLFTRRRRDPDPQLLTELWRVSAEGGKPDQVNLAPMEFLHDVRVHPDGRRIVFRTRNKAQKGEVWAMENFLPERSSTE